jgi:hypothetical protein
MYDRDCIIGPELRPQRPDKAFVDLDGDNVTASLYKASGESA